MAVPLYQYSFKDALYCDELDQYQESARANVACRKEIEQVIRQKKPLNMELLCMKYGTDRMAWVLSATVQGQKQSIAFSRETVDWADALAISDIQSCTVMGNAKQVTEIINQYFSHIQSLGLHARDACLNDQEYAGKLLILKPEVLADRYRRGDYQYFFADRGAGCFPEFRDGKVYGEFLADGDRTYFYRSDFLGVADEEQLPDWARDKLFNIYDSEYANANDQMEQSM